VHDGYACIGWGELSFQIHQMHNPVTLHCSLVKYRKITGLQNGDVALNGGLFWVSARPVCRVNTGSINLVATVEELNKGTAHENVSFLVPFRLPNWKFWR
jgi:hypothetical protein